MNIERSSSRRSSRTPRPSETGARRVFPLSFSQARVFFTWLAAALVLVGLVATASQAGLKPVSTSGTGAVLALAAQLRSARLHAAAASGHTPDGRTILPRRMMHAGAIKSRISTAANVVPISGGVQTYDVANPPPAFRPLVGYGSAAALNNSSTNPPVYISTLTPTNLTPVWSADETFLIFSSNRTQLGAVNADATDGSGGSRFHLWAISVNGGEAFQITTSIGPAGGGEFFPALSSNNLAITFTSDASTPGVQNLYALPFSYSTLIAGTSAPTELSVTSNTPTPPISLTLRGSTEAASSAATGFDIVQRPTFAPGDPQLIVFSAHSVTPTGFVDPNAGHYHLYYLNTTTSGYDPLNVSYPGKLTNGPADDTDPTYAPDGSYIAFASTANATGFIRNLNNAAPTTPSATQDPNVSQSLSSGIAASRSVFLISGGLSSTGVAFGTVPGALASTGGRASQGSSAGFDDYGPAWSSFANQNQYTNVSGNFAYLAFARSTPLLNANHDIYFFQAAHGVSQVSTETLTPETAAGGANAAVHLNTDDNAGETTANSSGQGANAGNSFDDTYPTWSPFLSIFSISYMSDRTVTYNTPANGRPVEVAASVANGGTVVNQSDATANYSVSAGYSGLLVSQVLNLDPPTLLRFSSDEVVHVQAGANANPVTGTPNKLAATGGQSVTLTVRLSDREAGIDNTGGPNSGPRVYVQIKDPDSRYQDAQNAEHKVFVKDRRYIGQANQPLSDVTSGTADSSIGESGFTNYGDFGSFDFRRYLYPSYGPVINNINVNYVLPRGVHGGSYPAGANNPGGPPGTYIFVGRNKGGVNPNSVDFADGSGAVHIPNGDPRLFIPWGPEYECQAVNPDFLAGGTGDTRADNPAITVANPGGTVGDYVSPYWLAGVDDQGAFSGGTFDAAAFTTSSSSGRTGTDRPVANYTTTGTNSGGAPATTMHPGEWLQLTKVPTGTDGTQDGDASGGVLYSVTWTTPASGSDFYVDVIPYDNAVFPNFPSGTSSYVGQKTNWRIYDNVGGFSTNSSIGGNDILVVSDYALGQKFAATTFGGRNLNLNLVPKLFGTESYLTDVDVNILPDCVYAGIPTTATSYFFNPALQPFVSTDFFDNSTQPTEIELQNGLGVGSYFDTVIDDGTRVPDGTGTDLSPNLSTTSNVQSQRYTIWRILSRGPVPTTVLNSYLPTPVTQPIIVDPGAGANSPFASVKAATVLSAPRCVIWLSPYTGDLLADPGTLDDPGNIGQTGVTQPRSSTTSILASYVQNGGRLFITGQDVGSTLTQGGTVSNAPTTVVNSPNFLPDVLNATLVSNSGGTNILAATNNRITGPPTYDGIYGGRTFTNISVFQKGGTLFEVEFPNFAYQDNLVLGDADYGDGSFSQIPAQIIPGGASVQGQIDTISPLNGAIAAMTYGANGPAALVYHDDPYLGGTAGLAATATAGKLPNGGTGSRVVYAAFGIEGLSNDYETIQDPDPSSDTSLAPAYDERIPPVAPRNPRPLILHNIVSFLRTGFVNGTITQTAGTGQGGGLGIDGVTVYLRPASGLLPSTRAAFSALTANGGRFTIAGVEPGTYTLVAVKPGFQRAVSNSNISFTVEGDVTVSGATLTMTPEQPGGIAGVVHDPTGAQINGATVTFTSQDNSVTETMTTVNGSVPGNAAENYYIQNVPVTNYTGTAAGPLNPQGLPEYTAAATPDAPTATGAPDFSKGVVVQPTTITQPVNFTLTPILATISGTVTNSAGGAGLGGATVTLTDSAGKTVGTPTTTGTDGKYTLTNIPATSSATTYTLTVTDPGFAASSPLTEVVYLGSVITGQNVALTAIPVVPASLSGTITDAQTGAPVGGATVTLTDPSGAVVGAPFTTGTDGTYSFPSVNAQLTPTNYTLTVTAPGFAAATVTVALSQNHSTTQNVALTEQATLYGLATDGSATAAGQPLGGVTLTVTDSTGAVVATVPAQISTTNPPVAGPDGQPSNYLATLVPGTYTVTTSKVGYQPLNKSVTLTNLAPVRLNFALISSVGTLGGIVTNLNDTGLVAGATVTALLPGQTTGVTFATSGTSTTGPDGSAINYTGTLPSGTYTITVTKGTRTTAAKTVTIVGGVFNRVDFNKTTGLPTLHTFPAGLQFVSTPYDYSALGFNGLFGPLNTALSGQTANGNRSNVAVWNPLTGAYALDPNAPADTLRLGVGYWVALANPTAVTQQGSTPSGNFVPVSLSRGWNQIGVPNPASAGVPISSLMFDNGSGGMITFAQASSSQYNLIKYPLYGYTGGTIYQSLTSSNVLTPWQGYWIYVSAAATLEIPTH